MTLFLYAHNEQVMNHKKSQWRLALSFFYGFCFVSFGILSWQWEIIAAWHKQSLMMMVILDATLLLTYSSCWSYIHETLKEFQAISNTELEQLTMYALKHKAIQRYIREVQRHRSILSYDYHRCMYYSLFQK